MDVMDLASKDAARVRGLVVVGVRSSAGGAWVGRIAGAEVARTEVRGPGRSAERWGRGGHGLGAGVVLGGGMVILGGDWTTGLGGGRLGLVGALTDLMLARPDDVLVLGVPGF